MKKLLLATAVMFCIGVSLVQADRRLTPTGEVNSLATADYGGVDFSTYTTNLLVSGAGVGYGTATIANTSGVFYGILYSSGSTFDFTDVFDSTSSDNAKNQPNSGWRIYNVAQSTGGVGAYAAGFSGLVKPVRFNKGLIYRPSRADFNSLNILYYQAP